MQGDAIHQSLELNAAAERWHRRIAPGASGPSVRKTKSKSRAVSRSSKRTDSIATLLVVNESQATWPRCASSYRAHASELVLVAQSASEEPIHFAERVIDRAATISAANHHLVAGILRVNFAVDREHLAARCLMARALISQMLQYGTGHLVLSGDARLCKDGRQQLFALVDLLKEHLTGTQLLIRVELEAQALEPVAESSQPLEPAESAPEAESDSEPESRSVPPNSGVYPTLSGTVPRIAKDASA